ncbi:MAG: orotate phosphoribosyltransferase [Richelia sp. RM2_1_2]|nr:orotate phosphoribosyltransferase [Richelia sp. RM2_1_2]
MYIEENLRKRIKELCTINGDFTLSSGQKSNIYFDKYLLESDPLLLEEVCIALMYNLPIKHKQYDFIAGLETGGIPLAVTLSRLTKIPTLFVRKTPKTYGTCKFAEGGDIIGKRLLVVEDVVTSGTQVLKSCENLSSSGTIIDKVCCVILRSDTGKQRIETTHSFYALFNFTNEASQ